MLLLVLRVAVRLVRQRRKRHGTGRRKGPVVAELPRELVDAPRVLLLLLLQPHAPRRRADTAAAANAAAKAANASTAAARVGLGVELLLPREQPLLVELHRAHLRRLLLEQRGPLGGALLGQLRPRRRTHPRVGTIELGPHRVSARAQLLQLPLDPLARLGRLLAPRVHLLLLQRQLLELGGARLGLALQLGRLQHPLGRSPLHLELHLGDPLALEPRLKLDLLHLRLGLLLLEPIGGAVVHELLMLPSLLLDPLVLGDLLAQLGDAQPLQTIGQRRASREERGQRIRLEASRRLLPLARQQPLLEFRTGAEADAVLREERLRREEQPTDLAGEQVSLGRGRRRPGLREQGVGHGSLDSTQYR